MENRKGKVLELVVCLAILAIVLMLAMLGKLPKAREIEIPPESTPLIMDRVQ